MRRPRLARSAWLLAVLPLVGAGCGDAAETDAGTAASTDVQAEAAAKCVSGAPVSEGERLQIASTVAPITSIVANVAGDLADITGLVPEGTNSHTFEPPPSVAATLASADVVFANGLVLEEPTKDLAAANMPDDSALCELGTAILPINDYIYDFSFPREGGKPNPHLWTNPPMAKRYATLVRDVLVTMDPANSAAYEANAAAYIGKIDDLDAAVRTATATLPAEQRKLLTYHDAYAYFAETYGWEVIGAIQPSSFDEPTPREVAELIEQVRDAGVAAIFGSEVFPSPVLEQIGKEAGVEYVDVLRDDDLPGEPGDPDHSFLGLMQFDYVTMVGALGGDASAIAGLDVSDVATDTADYPPVTTLVELDGVSHSYGGPVVLDHVHLAIEAGSFLGVIGPSGSGKTTLLRLVLGNLRPSHGTVRRRDDLRLAYVPQVETVNWNFPITVGEVVLMAATSSPWRPWASAAERREVARVLEQLGLAGLERRHIRELSGGQQQRVFLARALHRRPELLVLDEPTSGVDVRTRHEVVHLLTDLHRDGMAVILTTHDINGLAAHLPRIACVNRELIALGTPREVLTPDVLERTYGAPMEVLEHGGLLLVTDSPLDLTAPAESS